VLFTFEDPLLEQRNRFSRQGKLSGEVIRPSSKEEKEKVGGEIGTASGGVHYMSSFNPNAGNTRSSSAVKRATPKKKSTSVKKSVTPTMENKTRTRHLVGGFSKRALKDAPNRAGPSMNKYFN
jgi:hypothetical protein